MPKFIIVLLKRKWYNRAEFVLVSWSNLNAEDGWVRRFVEQRGDVLRMGWVKVGNLWGEYFLGNLSGIVWMAKWLYLLFAGIV